MRDKRIVRRFLELVADDTGSMIIALMAVVVASGLMISVTTYAVAAQRQVRFDRSHVSVIQGADAGLNEAIYRLNRPVGTPSCSAPSDTECKITAAFPS